MTTRNYDALLIDFYGTICAGDRQAVEETCARIVGDLDIDMTPESFAIRWGERFFSIVGRSNHESFQTLHDCERASLRETLAALNRDADPDPFIAHIEAYWRNPPLHPDVLEALSRIDLPICCVSNADTEPLMAAIEKHALVFDGVVSSEDARSYKPDSVIFEKAAALLNVDPHRLMHVGDSLHSDIAGAKQLGITAIWICREDRIHDIGTCEPDHTITTLNEIPALL